MDPLKTLDWRFERAHEHLTALNDERLAFLAGLDEKDRRIVGQFERDTSEYVFRVNSDPPDDARIGILVSEFAHHLRAALDNLVWQLVLLRGGSPTRHTQFPIYESWERYQSSLWMLRGVSADDRALIEWCQPFQEGVRASETYLALLAWLNNVDKHRFVHVGCARPVVTAVSVSYGDEGEYVGQFPWNPRPVRGIRKILGWTHISPTTGDDRTELVRVVIDASDPDPQMEMDDSAPIEISVSDARHNIGIQDLVHMRNLVLSIVNDFRQRFDI